MTEGCSPESAGRPQEAGGDTGPRWMAASHRSARTGGDRIRRTARLVCRPPHWRWQNGLRREPGRPRGEFGANQPSASPCPGASLPFWPDCGMKWMYVLSAERRIAAAQPLCPIGRSLTGVRHHGGEGVPQQGEATPGAIAGRDAAARHRRAHPERCPPPPARARGRRPWGRSVTRRGGRARRNRWAGAGRAAAVVPGWRPRRPGGGRSRAAHGPGGNALTWAFVG